MNKRFKNKKPYEKTGMAKRLKVKQSQQAWRDKFLIAIKKISKKGQVDG